MNLPLRTKDGHPVEIVTLYQLGRTDGYSDKYDGPYYRTEAEARKDITSGYIVGPRPVKSLELDFGRFLLLESSTPITIKGEDTYKRELDAKMLAALPLEQREAVRALRKLPEEERRALGL